jgi:hypothetical protein
VEISFVLLLQLNRLPQFVGRPAWVEISYQAGLMQSAVWEALGDCAQLAPVAIVVGWGGLGPLVARVRQRWQWLPMVANAPQARFNRWQRGDSAAP